MWSYFPQLTTLPSLPFSNFDHEELM